MTGDLVDKVALVTGGAGGIGRATARAFAREGAMVIMTDLVAPHSSGDDKGAEGRIESQALDVTDAAAVDAIVAKIVATYGRLDIAFNNAGISLETETTPWDDAVAYARVVAVNQTGVFNCMAAELRVMAEQGGGAIVNTASVAGVVGLSGPGYCGSKHAVIGLTRSAAVRFAGRGVRVNAVCPGAIDTPMTRPILADADGAAFLASMAPMGRVAKPEEVAEAVVFLASDRSSFVTGHPLAIDGGFLAR